MFLNIKTSVCDSQIDTQHFILMPNGQKLKVVCVFERERERAKNSHNQNLSRNKDFEFAH